MKINRLILITFMTLFCVLSTNTTNAQLKKDVETVDEDEVVKWLRTYAVDSTTMVVKNILKPQNQQDSINYTNNVVVDTTLHIDSALIDYLDMRLKDTVYTNKIANTDSIKKTEEKQTFNQIAYSKRKRKSYLDTIKKISVYDILSTIDTIEIKRHAIIAATSNPLFIDWTFSYPDTIISLDFKNGDSIKQELHAEVRRYARTNSPDMFWAHKEELPEFNEIKVGYIAGQSPDELKLSIQSLSHKNIQIDMPEDPFWKYGMQIQIHTAQNYISPNWYKGGESTLTGLSNINAFINYNDKKYIQWDNKFEWKVGINGSTADTMRFFRINEDIVKITTKLGVKAFDDFYYTAEGEFSTQLFNTFVTNTNERTTAPFSPIRTYLSIGLDYKYKSMLSVFLSPVSYKYVFVADTTVKDGVDPAQSIARKVGINPGRKDMHQLGGLIRVSFVHQFTREIGVESKFSLFANYVGDVKGIELDWEIIGNFLINRYLSAKISLHPRYDTTIKTTDGSKPKMQFNELISFGFNYIL